MHLGLAFAALSAVFNGSFGSLAKLPPVRKVRQSCSGGSTGVPQGLVASLVACGWSLPSHDGSLTTLPTCAQVSPIVFNYWMCEGAALAGVLGLAAEPRVSLPAACMPQGQVYA